MRLPYICIIILHYKNLADTRECFESLQKLDYPHFSVIVVNNDISDHKIVLEHEYGDFIKIIQNSQNLGFCEGNNVGIRYALADELTDAVLLLNNDTAVEKDFLGKMVEQDADMICPRMMQFYNKDKIDNLGIVLMSSGLPFNRTDENQKLFCPNGGCALYTRKLLEAVAIHDQNPHPNPLPNTGEGVSYFDPLYFAYCEDLDLGWRARNAGFEAGYAKGAVVYHKGSAIHGKLSDFAVYHTYRNLIWTQFKNMPLTMLLRRLPWLALGNLAITAYYIIKGRGRVILKAYWNGKIGLLRMMRSRKENLKQKTAPNKTILSLFEKGLFPKQLMK
ncbi:MAG: hypothetical protein COW93_03155 [Parcubacteria group bacterium CG22_combo_CG10-13_8_21_14_all_41_9]|nr:MAG: hypothetical protein COW93_03155 [Parcubacteria group bacterium CG22_combo_CG10-13_8_21_14_all_41_9]